MYKSCLLMWYRFAFHFSYYLNVRQYQYKQTWFYNLEFYLPYVKTLSFRVPQLFHNNVQNSRHFHIISARFGHYQKYAAPFINMKVSINYGMSVSGCLAAKMKYIPACPLICVETNGKFSNNNCERLAAERL